MPILLLQVDPDRRQPWATVTILECVVEVQNHMLLLLGTLMGYNLLYATQPEQAKSGLRLRIQDKERLTPPTRRCPSLDSYIR